MNAPVLPAAEIVVEGADEETWLAARQYGGSDIAAILGVSRYKTPISLYLDKTGQMPREEREEMRWGKRLEQPIADGFSEDTGIPTFQPPPITMYRSKQLAIATASPDRFIGTPEKVEGLYEGKNTRLAQEWDADEGRVPIAYEAQTVWNCGVLGVPYGELVALIQGSKLVHVQIEFDALLFSDMLAAVERFDRLVQARQMPDPDDTEVTRKALTHRRGELVDEIELDEAFLSLWHYRHELSEEIKSLEAKVDGIDNRILAVMGDHKVARVGKQKIASQSTIAGGHVEYDRDPYRRLTVTTPQSKEKP